MSSSARSMAGSTVIAECALRLVHETRGERLRVERQWQAPQLAMKEAGAIEIAEPLDPVCPHARDMPGLAQHRMNGRRLCPTRPFCCQKRWPRTGRDTHKLRQRVRVHRCQLYFGRHQTFPARSCRIKPQMLRQTTSCKPSARRSSPSLWRVCGPARASLRVWRVQISIHDDIPFKLGIIFILMLTRRTAHRAASPLNHVSGYSPPLSPGRWYLSAADPIRSYQRR